jgi:filamentous hemagglutinin
LLNEDGDPTNEVKAAQASNEIKIGSHILKDLSKRGWTKDLIKKTIQKPARKVVTRDTRYKSDGSGRLNEPATAYLREDGSYVVRNDKTGDIVQISNRNDPNWKSPFK